MPDVLVYAALSFAISALGLAAHASSQVAELRKELDRLRGPAAPESDRPAPPSSD